MAYLEVCGLDRCDLRHSIFSSLPRISYSCVGCLVDIGLDVLGDGQVVGIRVCDTWRDHRHYPLSPLFSLVSEDFQC